MVVRNLGIGDTGLQLGYCSSPLIAVCLESRIKTVDKPKKVKYIYKKKPRKNIGLNVAPVPAVSKRLGAVGAILVQAKLRSTIYCIHQRYIVLPPYAIIDFPALLNCLRLSC